MNLDVAIAILAPKFYISDLVGNVEQSDPLHFT